MITTYWDYKKFLKIRMPLLRVPVECEICNDFFIDQHFLPCERNSKNYTVF